MEFETIEAPKKIALVAHDNKKKDLLEWARYNAGTLSKHEIYATGTTGLLLETELGIPIHRLLSGPLGGDQQIGALISEGQLDFLIFFWDPLEPQPHDPDVKALLRIAVVWNVPIACNRATADYIVSSPLLDSTYQRSAPNFDLYQKRRLEVHRENLPHMANDEPELIQAVVDEEFENAPIEMIAPVYDLSTTD